MSILRSLGRRRHLHLNDDAIAGLWCERATADGTVAIAGPDAGHLEACAPCRARYEAFADWLADARVDALGEAEEVFPADRLAMQQSQILRRLEALDRPARVIAFPRFSQPVTTIRRGPQRWIAAAAAAGLIVGLGAGQLLDVSRSLGGAARASRLADDRLAAGQSARVQPVSLESDDVLLYDAEAVGTSPRVEALQALDALTPRLLDLDQAR